MAKINILVIPSDNRGGVGFFRSTQPHIQLEKQYPEDFHVTIEMEPDFNNLEYFDQFDLIHIHKGIFLNMEGFYRVMEHFKEKKIITVMDIDDFWELHPHHPLYVSQKHNNSTELIRKNLKIFDYITTTTPLFAEEIKKYNKNVVVLPNAIDPTDKRFAVNKKPSKFLRVGLVMGSSHEHDMALLNNIANKLPNDIIEKIQFVLCGFDLRGTFKEYSLKPEVIERLKNMTPKQRKQVKLTNDDYAVTTRPMQPKENVWYRYELMLTDNYRIVSPEYKTFLESFLSNVQYPEVENEHYKRCWTKKMDNYYEHYSECDVLLAPIEVTPFNKVKSQLKAIEAAFSHTAIIASNYGPYTIDLKNAIEKGGTINPEGNALLVSEDRNHKDWAKYIEKVAKNPDLLKQLQDNLQKDLCEKYDLRNVTKERAAFYNEIVEK